MRGCAREGSLSKSCIQNPLWAYYIVYISDNGFCIQGVDICVCVVCVCVYSV